MAAGRQGSWSREEVEATVADYLRMLRLELAGLQYNKSAHHRDLARQLNGRTPDAVALKHQNISAILVEQGCVYIPGYKPMGHYQLLLSEVVLTQVNNDTEIDALALQAVERRVVVPDLESLRDVRVDPPRVIRKVQKPGRDSYLRRGIKRNYLQIESQNRSLGLAGELFVAGYEARRLHTAGQHVLAERVEHVAQTRGDGLGYDVLSFDVSGRERFIEVKTTNFGATTPFYVSRNEVAFSDGQEQFVLARVHEFSAAAKFFELKGALRKNVLLDPVSFIARL